MGLHGYIKLYRKLLENPIFQNANLLKVFIWCLLKATHKECVQVVGLQKVKLLPGQFVYGRNKAAEELRLKPSTAHKYMMWLKNDGILNIQGNNKFSLVTVVNWELYQVKDNENDSKSNSKITTKEQQRDTNKNGKNGKNINPPYPLNEFCFSKQLEDQILLWLRYKTEEKRDTYKPIGFKSLLTEIKKHSEQHGEQAVISLIGECMAANYKGIVWDKLKPKQEERIQW